MKKLNFLISVLFLFITLLSCNNKKLTEVVEVPLPTTEQTVAIMGSPDDVKADEGSFQLEKLPYAYNALAPNISATTLEMHYSKHYLTYTNNLNKAVLGTPLENLTIEEVLSKLVPNDAVLRNNAGGFYNHSLYWKCMAPKAGGEPTNALAEAIIKDFGSFENFVTLFKEEATKQFGSGWAWLIVDRTGKLQVTGTSNQDNPLMRNALIPGTPILALDVWEHAYYLDYQYRRKNYIDAFFNVINWRKVEENYDAILKN
ncbi:superoxide dismutase [Flavobacterium sp. XS2P24]|uniref:superoxide dismutase n=1 Tax=Flavobacterium sp. XS2P24 TaxID=3041249 RepID=UPI0024A98A43|nr:superoxide dismutase [Flavobacterium sp. XS2P24]MDI6050271.1 superoxide dismutase [Flavobacterium sp. XS2P24]